MATEKLLDEIWEQISNDNFSKACERLVLEHSRKGMRK